jgi:ribosomal protein L16 Arg81 hydroxylase
MYSQGLIDPFATLLHPLPLDEFRTKWWNQRSVLVRGCRERFESLLSWDVLNVILNSNRSPHPAVIVAKSGERITPRDTHDLIGLVQRGATLVVEDADQYHPNLRSFANSITASTGHNTRLNIYLSHPGRAAYKLHYDTHDVYILQVYGTKRWKVFPPTVVHPLYNQIEHGVKAPPESDLYLDETLRAGDLLYVPRGHWHSVLAVDEPSLHITMAVFPRSGIFFLKWLVDEMTEDPFFREDFPLFSGLKDAELLQLFQLRIEQLRKSLDATLTRPALADEFLSHWVAGHRDRPVFDFPSLIFAPTDSLLANARFTKPLRLDRVSSGHNDTCEVVVRDRLIVFAATEESVVRYVCAQHKFSFKDIIEATKASPASITRVLKTLIQEGVLLLDGSIDESKPRIS